MNKITPALWGCSSFTRAALPAFIYIKSPGNCSKSPEVIRSCSSEHLQNYFPKNPKKYSGIIQGRKYGLSLIFHKLAFFSAQQYLPVIFLVTHSNWWNSGNSQVEWMALSLCIVLSLIFLLEALTYPESARLGISWLLALDPDGI